MKKISLFMLCFIFWLLLVWRLDAENIIVGIVISLFSAVLFGNLVSSENKIQPFNFLLFFINVLCLWIKASVIEIYFALLPQKIDVEDFEVTLKTTSEKSRAFLIMALNLSPNITVIDAKDDKLIISSHGRPEEKVRKDVEKSKEVVGKIFVC